MELQIKPMSEAAAREVCRWKYPGEYAVSNYPAWEDLKTSNSGPANDFIRETQFYAVYDRDVLAAHFRLAEDGDSVTVGLGFCSEYCGKGAGSALMALVKDCARERFPNKPLRLFVRTFNQRAIRCYERAGFRRQGIIKADTPTGEAEMYDMILEGNLV